MGELIRGALAEGGVSLLVDLLPWGAVLFLTGHWRLFEKAGQPGWKIFVPGYHLYILAKIAWGPGRRLWLALLLPFAAAVLCGAAALSISGFFSYILSALDPGDDFSLLFFYIPVLVMGFFLVCETVLLFAWWMLPVLMAPTVIQLARAFGKPSPPFALGMVFLYPIFSAILAFGPAVYHGPPPPRTAPAAPVTRYRDDPWELP